VTIEQVNRDVESTQVSAFSIFMYMLPPIGCGYMFCLVNLYIMKFATDILLIAPAVMGLIFGISRIWDAVSDPLVGYYSDKTHTSIGRRRPWILASIIPIFLSFWMISAPPESLSMDQLAVWMGIAVIAFYSAQTIFIVPHMSLGAELSVDYHERNKVFAARHAGWIGGYVLALGTMYWLISAEAEGDYQVRALAENQSYWAGVLTTICLLACVVFLRERKEFLGRGAEKPWGAMRDILANPHAKLLLIVNFIENLGGASIVILSVYNAEYVMKNAQMAPLFILSYMVFSVVLVPFWIKLARRFGKKPMWVGSLFVTGICFAFMGILQPGQELHLLILAGIAGAAGGCGGTVSPSIKSDIIDYDELLTGQRKEGAYFAAWNFVGKSAYGVMLSLTGFALSWAGFVPKADQTELVENTLRFLYGGVPLICYMAGTYLLLRFSFNEGEHAEVRAALDAKGNAKVKS
jgi:Na+/melibiose symporter-like transporter